MRQAFCESMVREQSREEFLFLTGDLGFKALEPLREAIGTRFINAGVAEQNMVSVAAGLSRQGFRAWTYSIAPFMYARPFEQIRNDVCLHRLPVVMVGNGGGYGYGVMGATHHAIEDYGVLLTLNGLDAVIPAFDSDFTTLIPSLFTTQRPTYLRLGLEEKPKDWTAPAFAPWRKLGSGQAGTLIAVGPIAGSVWATCMERPEEARPNLWCLSQLPVADLPEELWRDISQTPRLVVAEEHVATGSAGSAIALKLARMGGVTSQFRHVTALGYPSGLYGSQKFHRAECGLAPANLLAAFDDKAAL